MSKYTTQVRYICESLAGNKPSDNSNYDDVITKAAPLIFKNYPIFDESHRSILNEKILRHYYTREIAYETSGLWMMKINTKMREIMPYYNQLYETELIQIDPLNEFDWGYSSNTTGSETAHSDKQDSGSTSGTRTGSVNDAGKRDYTDNSTTENTSEKTGTNDNTNTVSATSNTEGTTGNTRIFSDKSKSIVDGGITTTGDTTTSGSNNETVKYSDTPQGSLRDVLAGDYLTNVTVKNGSTSGTQHDSTEQSNNSTNDFTDDSTTTDSGESSNKVTDNSTTTDKGSTSETITENGKHDITFAETNSNDRTIKDETSGDYSDTSIVDSNGNSKSDTVYKTKGFRTAPAQLIKMYRDILLNIDKLIIDELETEFFGLW